jgi:hypothetical protein
MQAVHVFCAAIVAAIAGAAGGTALRFEAAPGSPIPAGKGPNAILAGDLNADGAPDLVATNGRSSTVSILLGDGRGRFAAAPASPLSLPTPPHLAALGDLNADRHVDLAVTSHDSHDVQVFLGDGHGRFAAAAGSPFAALPSGRAHNHGLALGDVDGDGDLDLATTDDEAHCVPVLLNDGKARFAAAPASPFSVAREPYPLALADLNGDGRLDLLTPNVGAASVSVLLGDGRAGFTRAAGSPISVTSRPYSVSSADLNGDSRIDAVLAHDDSTAVTILLGDGRGGFRNAPRSPLDVGKRVWKSVVHDMNQDGKPDLVLGAGGVAAVLLGDGAGGFRPAGGSPFRVGREAWSVAVADFDRDGKPDIASADLAADTVSVLLQR